MTLFVLLCSTLFRSGDDVVEEIVEKKVNDVKMLEEAAEEEQEEAEAIM